LWAVIALTLLTLGRLDLLVVASCSIALLLMITNRAFHSVEIPENTTKRHGLYRQGVVFLDRMFVLFAAALSFPFLRQGSSYNQLGPKSAPGKPREPAVTGSVVLESPTLPAPKRSKKLATLDIIGPSIPLEGQMVSGSLPPLEDERDMELIEMEPALADDGFRMIA
jgi:hypothetical protein